MTARVARSVRVATCFAVFATVLANVFATAASAAEAAKGLPVADVKRSGPVHFEKEILPILRSNCLACHNVSKTEGELVLETPQSILAGGASGPAVVPGKAAESLLFRLAAHTDEPVMPPAGNDRNAANLGPEQLGLLKRWIDEGATGTVTGGGAIAWQPLPASFHPVYAVAVSPDGSHVAAARGNQVSIYEVASRREVGRLVDPTLPAVVRTGSGASAPAGAAHVDTVQSLAFSPDGERLASGSYRSVTIWKHPRNVRIGVLAAADAEPSCLAVSPDGSLAAIGEAGGRIHLDDMATGKRLRTLTGHTGPVAAVAFNPAGDTLLSGAADRTARLWDVAAGKELGAIEAPAAVTAVAIVAAGMQAAVATDDHAIRIWPLPFPSLADAKPQPAPQALNQLSGHTARITSLVPADPQGSRLLSGSHDGTARLWNVADGKELQKFQDGGLVTSAAIRPDGKRVATASEFGRVQLWNAEDGKVVATIAAERETTGTIDRLKLAAELAKRRVANAKEDLTQVIKARDSEREAVAAAVLEEAKSVVDVRKKTAAVEPALAEAAKAAAEAEKDKTKTDAAKKAETAAKKAESDKEFAIRSRAAAAVGVTRTRESLAKAEARIPPAQAEYDVKKLAEKAAIDELAMAERAAQIRSTKIKDLEGRRASAEKFARETTAAEKQAAVAAAAEAQKAAARAFIEATAEFEKATASAMTAEMRAMTLVQQTTDFKGMADLNVTEIEERVKAATAAQAAAAKAVTTAKQKLDQAKDDDTKTLAAAELVNATDKQRSVDQELAEATARKTAAVAEKAAAEARVAAGRTEAAQVREAAKRELEAATARLKEVTAVVQAADVAAGGVQAQLETTGHSRLRASQAMAEERRPVRAVTFSPDGVQVAMAGDDGAIRLFESEGGRLLDSITAAAGKPVTAAVFVSVGRLLSMAADRSLVVWNTLPAWEPERRLGKIDAAEPFIDRVNSLDISPDGRRLATGGGLASRSGELTLWDLETGGLVRRIPDAHEDSIQCVRFSPDGKHVASAAADRLVRVFEVESGKPALTFDGHGHHVLTVAWRADGRVLVSGGIDKTIKSWDVRSGEARGSLPALLKEVTGVQFIGSSDSLLVSSGEKEKNVVLRDKMFGAPRTEFKGSADYVFAVGASRTGRVVAAGGQDGVVRIWSEKGQEIAAFRPPAAGSGRENAGFTGPSSR